MGTHSRKALNPPDITDGSNGHFDSERALVELKIAFSCWLVIAAVQFYWVVA